MKPSSPSHFEGKTPEDHLKEARLKGLAASSEMHGMEMPGHIIAFADAMKDMTIALLILWSTSLILIPKKTTLIMMILFGLGWLIWKPARSAIVGWGRLNRLHRLIEEERWEIEHNREQEKIELREMYRSKGFSGKLLDDVIDVLMSDDNRLLQIMLEEELGLTLGIHEHPLKQACGAALGALASSFLIILGFYLFPIYSPPMIAAFLIVCGSVITSHFEKNPKTTRLIWILATAAMITATTYIASKAFI
jgi:hypothetical protein